MANGEEWEKELSLILTAPSFIHMSMIYLKFVLHCNGGWK